MIKCDYVKYIKVNTIYIKASIKGFIYYTYK